VLLARRNLDDVAREVGDARNAAVWTTPSTRDSAPTASRMQEEVLDQVLSTGVVCFCSTKLSQPLNPVFV
jgi:hypothetical protein